MVRQTNLSSLKPVTVQMIGALIRAIGERHPSAGKTAILLALATILAKAPLLAKPFIPQLQRTAIKNLSDPASSDVRNRAAIVLGALIPMQPRVDPLVTELVGVANSSIDDCVKFSIIKALCEVFSRAGKLVGESQKNVVCDLIHDILRDGRGTPSSLFDLTCIGQIVPIAVHLMILILRFLSAESSIAFICSEIIDIDLSKNSIIALNGFLYDPSASILDRVLDEVLSLTLKAAESTNVSCRGRRALM